MNDMSGLWVTRLASVRRILVTGIFVLLAAGPVAAFGADSYSGGVLTMPSLSIGSLTLTDVVVEVGSIVSGPGGSTAAGTTDDYDPASGYLSVATVVVGTNTYYNIVCTVKQLVSIGGVSGADSHTGADLSIPRVRLGGTVYTNIVITVGAIVSVGGGLPTAAWDSYDPSTGHLTIAAIDYGGRVYTNAVVTVGKIVSGGATGYVGYAYAASAAQVAQYRVGLNGQLSALTPATVGISDGGVQAIAVDSTSRFAYVTDSNSGAIYQYRIGADGALVSLNPAFVKPAFTPGLLVANPQGPYLYAAAGAAGIYQYDIGPDGSLSPMSNPLATGDTVEYSLGVNPDGTYLLVSASTVGVGVLSVHPIGAGGRVLSSTLYPTGFQGIAAVADTAASQIYQVTDNGILQFSGDGRGDFSPGVGASTPGNASLSGAVIDPSGRYFYVSGTMISQFTIGSDGTLQAVSPATVAAGTGATGIACDPAGRFVYVTTQGGGVLQFAIGAGGALEPLNPASATGSAPAVSLVVVPLAASAVP